MKNIGIFYGSSTGTTAKVARSLGTELEIDPNDIHDVETVGPAAVGEYEVLLLGSSTWGAGELQRNWFDFADGLKALSLRGKKIAIFGCGDQGMKKTFCNAVGKIYDVIKESGAVIIGEFNADGYTFISSLAQDPETGLMRGLVIDEKNRPDLTEKRIKQWTEKIKESI